MTLCSGITVGAINQNCDDTGNAIITGAAKIVMVYNFDDLDISTDFTFGTDPEDNKVTLITNPSGIAAFSFEGFRRTHKPSHELVPGPVSVGYNHIFDMIVLESTYTQKENLMRMNAGRQILVVENLDKSGDNSFEIYGARVGVFPLTNIRTIDDVESGAGFVIQLITGEDDSKEPLMPLTFDAGDYDSTKALFDALITPGV